MEDVLKVLRAQETFHGRCFFTVVIFDFRVIRLRKNLLGFAFEITYSSMLLVIS
jgi:hypothetical protein